MISPSISFDINKVKPLWSGLALDDVKVLIRNDVAELNTALRLQAEDSLDARRAERQPNYRFRILVTAWERTQDVHWSWYREMLNANTTAAEGSTGLGESAVGAGN